MPRLISRALQRIKNYEESYRYRETATEETGSCGGRWYGYLVFKDGTEINLAGQDACKEVKAAFNRGKCPVVSLSDGGLDEDECNVFIDLKEGGIYFDTPDDINTWLQRNEYRL